MKCVCLSLLCPREVKYVECWPYPAFDILLSVLLVQSSKECTLSDLSTGILNLLRPAQAEVMLGQLSTSFAYWVHPKTLHKKTDDPCHHLLELAREGPKT